MSKYAAIHSPNGVIVNATDVHLSLKEREVIKFYCACKGCDARMMIVSMGDHKRAHFSSYSRDKHRLTECLRQDIVFNSDQYDERLFHVETFFDDLLSGKRSISPHNGHSTTDTDNASSLHIGSNSRIPLHTLSAFYAAYLSVGINGTYGDCVMSKYVCGFDNYDICKNGFSGHKVVELTYYRALPEEKGILFNFPALRKDGYKNVKVLFSDESDRFRVINHYQQLKNKWKEPIVIAGDWKCCDDKKCIAQCIVSKSSQHIYPIR